MAATAARFQCFREPPLCDEDRCDRLLEGFCTPGFGSFDVYVSTRSSPNGNWSAPVNLGENVNTAGSETRSSLSRDLERMYFGRDGDIYSSTREKLKRAD